MRPLLGCVVSIVVGTFALVGLIWLAWQLAVVAVLALGVAVAWRLLRGHR